LLHAFFQEGERFGLKIRYSYEDQPLGTAGPLSLVKNLDDTFLVTNGDVSEHRRSGAIATIAMHQREVKIDLGVVHFDGGNIITGYTEKPSYHYHVSMGIYVFEPCVLSLVLKLIEAGETVVGFPFDGYWQDLGRADDYEQAVIEFEAMKPQFLGEV
jgi:NDP-sugar pyrophosphorylase family protein